MAFATVMENRISTLLTDLAGCLCAAIGEQIEAGEMEQLCFCGILPGNEVPFDYVDDGAGMAFVKFSAITPVESPLPSASGISCATEYDVTIQMGILQCVPVLHETNGSLTLPSMEEMIAATLRQAKEAGLMERVIRCCETTAAEGKTIDYVPYGPDGGALGGVWNSVWRLS